MSRVRTIALIIRAAKNWWTAILFKIGLARTAKIVFRNGQRLSFGAGETGRLVGCVRFFLDYPDGTIENGVARFRHHGRELAVDFGGGAVVSFLGNDWGNLLPDEKLRGRTVVDLGCSLGDTMVDFIARGARRVIGIEMLPERCRLAERNIALNDMRNVCRIENAAIGATRGSMMVDAAQTGSEHYRSLDETEKRGPKTVEIPVVALDDIVQRHRIESGSVIKVDLQGGEFEAFYGAPDEALLPFALVVIRYYDGRDDRAGDIAKHLERSGFLCSYLPPKRWGCGYLVARRSEQ